MKDLQKRNFTENLFENFRPKKTEVPVLAKRIKQRHHGTRKAKSDFELMQAGRNKLKQNLKKRSE